MKPALFAVAGLIAMPCAAAGQYSVLPAVGIDLDAADKPVSLSGYLAIRVNWNGDTTGFSIPRARLAAQARPKPYVGLKLQVDFATGGRVEPDTTVGPFELTDAFIQVEPKRDTTRHPRIQPRLIVGQMRVPFGLERLTPFSLLLTTDRSRASNSIAYGRDVGLTAEADVGSRAKFSLGVFNGEGANVFTNPDGQMLGVARVAVSPAPKLGIAGKFGVQGDDRRWGADVRWIPHRLTLEAEYLERNDGGVRARGGYALGGYRVLSWLQPVVKGELYHERDSDTRQDQFILGMNFLPDGNTFRLLCDIIFPTGDSEEPARRVVTQAVLRF